MEYTSRHIFHTPTLVLKLFVYSHKLSLHLQMLYPFFAWNRSLLDRFSYCKLGLEIAQHFNLKFADIAKDNLSNFNLNKEQDQIKNGRFLKYIYKSSFVIKTSVKN